MRISKLFLLAALAVTSMNVSATGVDANAARSAATRFLQQKAPMSFKAASTSAVKLAYTEASKVEGNDYYVFNFDGGGWVIIAGDDHAKEVLAYGDKGSFDLNDMPASMKGQLKMYKDQIEAVKGFKGQLAPNKAPNRITAVEPLTKTTWGQSEPMNRFTPMKNGEHTAVGCGPLAMAQIMYYWKYPEGSDAMGTYYVYGVGTIPALEATTFEYDKMLKAYTIFNPETNGVSLGTYTEEQALAVATLCRYAGHACKARYGNSGTSTGAYSYDQLAAFKQFGYNEGAELLGIDPSYYCSNYGHKYTKEEWLELINVELAANRPVAYHNVDFIDGHAWVVDGMDADGLLHMNWGFYERFDGWFQLDALSFHPYGDDEVWDFSGSSNEMIINLFPYEGYVIPGDDEVLIGDVDGSGEVGIADVADLIDYLLSQDAAAINVDAADVDGNGEIGIADVADLIDYILRGEW